MSEKELNHEVEGIVRRAPRQDCVEPQIWGRVSKNVSIILKCKKYETTKSLPRAGRPAKLRRSLVIELTKNPMVTLTEL
jgi:hypothetical protein